MMHNLLAAKSNNKTEYKEVYKSQLERMKEMGFNDEEKNTQMLIAAMGNVDTAIEYMMLQMNSNELH